MFRVLVFTAILCLIPLTGFAAEEGIQIYGVELGYIIKIIVMVAALVGSIWKGPKWASVKIKAAEYTQDKIKNESVEALMLNLERYAFSVVENLYEEQVRELKAAAKDGKLTKEEVTELQATAVKRLKASAGDLINQITGATKVNGNGLNELLSGEIRRAIKMNKAAFINGNDIPVARKSNIDKKVSN